MAGCIYIYTVYACILSNSLVVCARFQLSRGNHLRSPFAAVQVAGGLRSQTGKSKTRCLLQGRRRSGFSNLKG